MTTAMLDRGCFHARLRGALRGAAAVSRRGVLVLACVGLAACSSLNPFAAKPGNLPVELTEIRPSLLVRTLWSSTVGAGANYFFSPVVVGGFVYAAGADGTVVKLASGNGAGVWRVKAADSLSAGVGSDGSLVVVAAGNGEVVALGADGAQRWKTPTNTEILSAPAVGGGMVGVRTSDNRIYGLDAQSGARRWSYQRPNPALVLRGAPGLAIGDGVVFAGFPGGRLVAFNLANGAVKWDVSVAVPKGATELERVVDVVGMPIVAGREVCVASYQGRAACFDVNSGNPIWTRDISSGTGIGIDARFAFITDDRSVVHALARSGGASVWRNDRLLYRQVSAPASVGRAAVVADLRGVVHWIAREDGALIARANTDGSAVLTQPLSFDVGASPAVLVQTRAGALYAFGSD